MAHEIKVPTLPESVMDASVVKFYVQEGDTVEIDAPLMDLETDKIVLEVPSPVNGIISEITTELGAVVVALFDEGGEQVVSSGQISLRPGARVRVSSGDTPARGKP